VICFLFSFPKCFGCGLIFCFGFIQTETAPTEMVISSSYIEACAGALVTTAHAQSGDVARARDVGPGVHDHSRSCAHCPHNTRVRFVLTTLCCCRRCFHAHAPASIALYPSLSFPFHARHHTHHLAVVVSPCCSARGHGRFSPQVPTPVGAAW
jgi:hypothetical protein